MTESALLNLLNGLITRDQLPLITQVNVSLKAGEIALLTGPNGSGKSTLLTGLAGEKFLTSGTLQFGGVPRDQISLKELARKRSLMLQQDDAIDQLRARDVLELAEISPAIPQYTQEFVSKIFGSALYGKTLGSLSVGQRTRVFLAAAAIQNSEVMLLDEPTAGLDSEGISDLAEFLVSHSSQGHAVLLATHEDNLRSVASKEYFISEGTVSLNNLS
jgi:ABC-type multidrug transport system ATPase subunit